MKKNLYITALVLGLCSFFVRGFGCNLSDFSLTSLTYDSNNSQWVISTLLRVGGGITGSTKGGDQSTKTVAFGFYKNCVTPFTIHSFLPATLNAAFTGCNMPGSNLGPQGAPFLTQGTIMYVDPGYYGNPLCQNTPFACVTSTALCGNVVSAPYNLTFRTNTVPDSIRVFGVEGAGNPLGGCYPNADMKIVLPVANIGCPGPQQIAAGPTCIGIMPNYTSLGNVSYSCQAPPPATVTQSPAVGSIVGGVGATTTVSLLASFTTMQSASCSFTATVVDLTPPTISCPGPQTLNLNNACQVTVPNYAPLATVADNCSTPVRTQSPAAGSVLTGSMVTTFTITATDAAGNSSSCTFPVTTVESIPPNVICPGNPTVALDANCQATLQNYAALATVTDNCTTNPTRAQTPVAGTVLSGIGTTTVIVTATDASGNTGSCTMTVTTADQTPPTISCPANNTITLDANCQVTMPTFVTQATVSDNCTSSPTVTQSPAAGTVLTGAGSSNVVLTATDASGNSGTCNFTVTQADQSPPTITCPPNATIALNNACEAILPDYTVMATTADNCTNSPVVTQSPLAGTTLTGAGVTTVTLTTTDGSGNTATCALAVTTTAPLVLGTTTQSPLNPCVGDVVTLTALAGTGHLWSTGSSSQSVQVTTTGWYWVDVTIAPGCSGRDSIFVTFQALPVPTLSQVGNTVCTGTFTSYQWFLNGTPIPGATGSCTPILTSGNYTVEVTDANGCVGTGGPLSLVGIAPATNVAGFVVYPVPAQDLVYIQLAGPLDLPGDVILYDVTGKVVRKLAFEHLETQTAFSLQGLAQGSYFFEVRAPGYAGMKKVLKLR